MKTLKTTSIAIDTMNVFELARIERIKKSAEKSALDKKAKNHLKAYADVLKAMEETALANYKGDDADTFLANYVSADADYLAKKAEAHDKALDYARRIQVLTDAVKSATDAVKAFCDTYISDVAYACYINKTDMTESLRSSVRSLGFEKVDTADDKPFKNFVSTISVQRAIDKKHIETHTKCLNKATFKELVISLIADYMLETAGLFIDDELGFVQA